MDGLIAPYGPESLPPLPPGKGIEIGEAFAGLFEPYRHKAFYGGRGSAKSHTFAGALGIITAKHTKRVVCARQFQNSIKDSVKELIESKLEALGYIGNKNKPDRFEITKTEIAHKKNGSRYSFIGLERNPNSIKSLEGADICWVEEAQGTNQKSMDILIPTIRKPGSEIWWSWNPEDPEDPVDKLFRGKNPPRNSLIKEVSFLDNPYFDETTLRDEMEEMKIRDIERYNHIWLGHYRTLSDATMFRNWRVGIVDVPANLIPLFGADWGYSQDPTAFIKMYLIDKRTLYIEYEAYRQHVPMDDLPELFDEIPGARSHAIIADSARPETIDFMRRRGFRIWPAIKGANSVKDGITWMQGLEIVVNPRCVNTISEFKYASWEVDRHTGKVLNIPADRMNHAIDAIRYGTEASRRGVRVTV